MNHLQNYIDNRQSLILETKVTKFLTDDEKSERIKKLRQDIKTAERILLAIAMRDLRRTKRQQLLTLNS